MIKFPDFFSTDYIKLLNIFQRQQYAVKFNSDNRASFLLASQNWIDSNIVNRSNNLPISIKPVMPLELVVEDDGKEYTRVFSDLKDPVLPEQNEKPSAASGFGIPSTNLPPDRLDQVMGMLRVLNDKLDQILKK